MARSLISGSLIPWFLLVNLAATISLNGPAVSNPINPPIRIAKLKNPILVEEKLYGGDANACDCVRLSVRNDDADQDTTKDENSTMGKRHSFQGRMNSRNILPSYGWKIFHCALEGFPRPSQGSWCVCMWPAAPWPPRTSDCVDGEPFSEPTSSSVTGSLFVVIELSARSATPALRFCSPGDSCDTGTELGANFLLYLVSGKRKRQQRKVNPRSAVLSHQKLRQPTELAMGPDIMGPTYWY